MYRLRRSESIGLDSLTQLFRQTTYISCNTLLPLSRTAAISSLLRLKPYGHRTPATPPALTLLHHYMWTSPIFFPSSSTLVIVVLSLGSFLPLLVAPAMKTSICCSFLLQFLILKICLSFLIFLAKFLGKLSCVFLSKKSQILAKIFLRIVWIIRDGINCENIAKWNQIVAIDTNFVHVSSAIFSRFSHNSGDNLSHLPQTSSYKQVWFGFLFSMNN